MCAQGFALFGGPSVGGYVSKLGGRRMAAWMAAGFCLLAAIVTLLWRPDEKAIEQGSGKTQQLTGEALKQHEATHKEVRSSAVCSTA